jgi:enamine deaminase RidA (YjgF/YER057c/UK114 family)
LTYKSHFSVIFEHFPYVFIEKLPIAPDYIDYPIHQAIQLLKTIGEKMSKIAQRLTELNITLPAAGAPAAAYVMSAQTGNTLFLSGHIAKKDGQPLAGKLGLNMSTAEGKAAARAIAIDLMATMQAHLGNLDRVKRIVKVMSLVNSTQEYTEHHLVTNGCSELLFEVFGDAGKHARSAFGVAQIPLGACVEIELIAEVE